MRRALTAIEPLKDGNDVRVREVLEEAARLLAEEAEADDETRAVLRNVIGESYIALRVFPEAERHLTPVRSYVERELGSVDPLSIHVDTNWVAYLFATAEYARAIELARRTAPLALRVLGPTDAMALRLRTYLAEVPMAQGDEVDDAARCYDELVETLALCRQIMPAGHFRIQNAIFNLGNAHFATKQYADAKVHFEECLRGSRKRFGPESVFVAIAAFNLGETISMQKRPADARPYFEEAFEIASVAWGTATVRTYEMGSKLARIHLALDDASGAAHP
ncbi:MAG: tetratricopeptide repeat protein [bacterium]|nr:tetratricopeptide repeat protein [bacterium]